MTLLRSITRLALTRMALAIALAAAVPVSVEADVPESQTADPQSSDTRASDTRAADPQTTETKQKTEMDEAVQAAQNVAVPGPKDVPLANHGILHLPEGYTFIPQPAAGQLSRAFGNSTTANLIGLVTPPENGGWIAYLDYLDDGYVKDDDAKSWNADELLQSLKDGTEAANAERVARGFDALEVAGWVEPPAYDSKDHRLVWSALGRTKGGGADTGSVNYNTYALGRDGHFELNLISGQETIDANKIHAKTLLAALAFNDGKRYEDFNPTTDKVAAYGLAALIGGIAAKKLGLIAVMLAFAAKFIKLIAIAAIAGVAGLKSLFKGRSGKG